VKTRALIAAGVTSGAIALGALVAWWFGHWSYAEILQTIETFVEVAILVFVVLEGIKVVAQVTEIHDATASTVGTTEALPVGSRVHVLMPQAGKPREQWPYSGDIWVIREVDKEKNRATATPIYPPLNAQGQIPTVTGPMTGPHSPFIKANTPG
jgi:hypothetical protein